MLDWEWDGGWLIRGTAYKVIREYIRYVDSDEAVGVVFLMTFDKVPYVRLLQKLKSHGITGKLLS